MGFENKFSTERFLQAVRRGRTLSDAKLGERLGVSRTTVWRFKRDNPKIVKQAEELLKETTSNAYLSKTKPTTEEFIERYPIIQDWIEMQRKNEVGESTVLSRVRIMNSVCHHLRTTPEALSLDQASDLVYEMKAKKDAGEPVPKGLSFYYIRSGVRSWFMLIHQMSAQILSSKGIHAKASEGTGTMARERITKDQRARFEQVAGQAIRIALNETSMDWGQADIAFAEMELIGMAHFMYYTANRIESTHNIMLNDPEHILAGDHWEIHTIDKGKGGGLHWQKPLIGDGKEKLETYIGERFGIEKDLIPIKAREINSLLFPTLSIDDKARRFESLAMKIAHKLTGAKVTMQNHAWRHTFAQDWLHASDWNYELGAEIGGWSSTETMKKCYGKISKDAINRGLRRAMGQHVEDVTYELKW